MNICVRVVRENTFSETLGVHPGEELLDYAATVQCFEELPPASAAAAPSPIPTGRVGLPVPFLLASTWSCPFSTS